MRCSQPIFTINLKQNCLRTLRCVCYTVYIKMFPLAFRRLWDSSDPQWEPLSPYRGNLDQCWIFPEVASLPKFLQGYVNNLSQEVTPEPGQTSKESWASVAPDKVSIHDFTIRKRLGKYGIYGWVKKKYITVQRTEHKGSTHICQKQSPWWDDDRV